MQLVMQMWTIPARELTSHWEELFPMRCRLGRLTRQYAPLRALSVIGLLTLFSQLTCGGDQASSPPPHQVNPDAGGVSTGPFEVLVGAGNVARCDKTNDEATGALLDNI